MRTTQTSTLLLTRNLRGAGTRGDLSGAHHGGHRTHRAGCECFEFVGRAPPRSNLNSFFVVVVVFFFAQKNRSMHTKKSLPKHKTRYAHMHSRMLQEILECNSADLISSQWRAYIGRCKFLQQRKATTRIAVCQSVTDAYAILLLM